MSDPPAEPVPTDGCPNSLPLGSSLRRACEQCRARKIRCDRNCPCSHCLQSNIPCTKGVRQMREKRSRVLVSTQYEQKIDGIDRRLDGVTKMLQELKTSISSPAPRSAAPSLADKMDFAGHMASTSPHGEAAQSTVDSPVVEGESSLSAHSSFANDFLRMAVENTTLQHTDMEMRQALDSLGAIVGALKQQTARTEMSYPFANPALRPSLRNSQLPPIQKAVALMHAAKTNPFDASAWLYDLFPMETVSDICLRVYFCEEIAESEFIIVNSGLMQLFMERSQSMPDERSENEGYAAMCRTNLETALVNLPLHLPASPRMITALLLGAMHAIEMSKPSLSWTLSSKASELCQTLGYHRLPATIPNPASDELDQKQFLFWLMYFIDKGLSLRLGRPSTIQNWNISTPMLSMHGTRSPLGSSIALWVSTARCQGDVYEKLYSPEAMAQPSHIRQARVEALANELNEIERKSLEANDHRLQPARDRFGNQLVEYLILSDDVLRLSLLTMVYRASPPLQGSRLTFIPQCVTAARATLQRHQDFFAIFGDVNSLYFQTYVNWTLLLAPFTPFIVLFCHVIETRAESDLKRLHGFLISMESISALSDAASKMQRLFQTLYQVALRYLEECPSTSQAQESRSNNAISAYLTTLGFAQRCQPGSQHNNQGVTQAVNPAVRCQPSIEAETAMTGVGEQGAMYPATWNGNADELRQWFDSNQHLLDLLEEPVFSFSQEHQ